MSELDTYVTTTIFAPSVSASTFSREDSVDLPVEPLLTNQSSSEIVKSTVHHLGGIDMVPIHKQIDLAIDSNADDQETQQADHNNGNFDYQIKDSSDADVYSSSPYHLMPGYKGKDSPEEQAKLHHAESPAQPAQTPVGSIDKALPVTAENPQPSEQPYLVPKPVTILDEDTTFSASPVMDDVYLDQETLQWERLPSELTLEKLVKEPYKGLEPDEIIDPPVHKIMTGHIPPAVRSSAPTTTSSTSTSEAAILSPTTDLESKGKQVIDGETNTGSSTPTSDMKDRKKDLFSQHKEATKKQLEKSRLMKRLKKSKGNGKKSSLFKSNKSPLSSKLAKLKPQKKMMGLVLQNGSSRAPWHKVWGILGFLVMLW